MLLQDVHPVGVQADLQTEICDICFDTRRLTPGCAFVCLEGTKADGHDYVAQAMKGGAALCICRKPPQENVPYVQVEDTRAALAALARNWHGRPDERLKLVAVTGTNGKTSTTFILKTLLEQAGMRVGLMGTTGNIVAGKALPATMTTPDPMELYGLLAQMADHGADYAVMEASSHALTLRKLEGLTFEAGIFSNLTQDHLDFHGDMTQYALAKSRLFAQCKVAVLNRDDGAWETMAARAAGKVYTYSAQSDEADYTARNLQLSAQGTRYLLVGKGLLGRVETSMIGTFAVYNTLAAASAMLAMGFAMDTVVQGLRAVEGVKGRLERVPADRPYGVFIDYAHTPDALEKVLDTLRASCEGRLLAVMGCGGDRDRDKRPKMGRIACQKADHTFITSDNPRSEKPEAIIEEIVAGCGGMEGRFTPITDRREAIAAALAMARKGDVVLLAGKGQETYQELATGKIHFDEREIVRDLLRKS